MTSILLTPSMLTVETFRAAGDGCLGYLVVDEASRAALAIDPRLDQVGAIHEMLTASGWRLMYALGTHTHADHLSGVWALAARTGAVPIGHAASRAGRIARRVSGGDTLELGQGRVRSLDAPGHTPDSVLRGTTVPILLVRASDAPVEPPAGHGDAAPARHLAPTPRTEATR